MRAAAKANMWLKRRYLMDWSRQACGQRAMSRTDNEANGVCSYRGSRRRAGGNHTMSGSQSGEGLGCSQDSP